jgi:hypothetical protein
MHPGDVRDAMGVVARLRTQAKAEPIRITVHAHQEMVEEDIAYAQLRMVLSHPQVLENYPDHKRGPCCPVCGQTQDGRFVHVVCTTSLEVAIVITVYEPKLPKWISPFARGERK